MTEPITCPKCRKLNSRPTGAPDEACPHCGVIYAKVRAQPVSAEPSATGRRSPQREASAEFIEQLRNQSAYPTFRAVVNISTIMGYVFGAATLVVGLIAAWGSKSYGLFFGTLFAGIAALVMTRVFKELAMMLADMSDATVRMARDGR